MQWKQWIREGRTKRIKFYWKGLLFSFKIDNQMKTKKTKLEIFLLIDWFVLNKKSIKTLLNRFKCWTMIWFVIPTRRHYSIIFIRTISWLEKHSSQKCLYEKKNNTFGSRYPSSINGIISLSKNCEYGIIPCVMIS